MNLGGKTNGYLTANTAYDMTSVFQNGERNRENTGKINNNNQNEEGRMYRNDVNEKTFHHR